MSRYLGIPPVNTPPYYFLSYNSKDQKWYDEGIEAGTKWEQSIARHVKTCKAFIMLLSKRIFQKEASFVKK